MLVYWADIAVHSIQRLCLSVSHLGILNKHEAAGMHTQKYEGLIRRDAIDISLSLVTCTQQ